MAGKLPAWLDRQAAQDAGCHPRRLLPQVMSSGCTGDQDVQDVQFLLRFIVVVPTPSSFGVLNNCLGTDIVKFLLWSIVSEVVIRVSLPCSCRPLDPGSEAHRAFTQRTLATIETLQAEYPHVPPPPRTKRETVLATGMY